MSAVKLNARFAIRLAEVAAAILLWLFAARGISAGMAAIAMPLPELPLLKHAYITFAVTLLVCLWFRLRGESFADIGLIKPKRWWPVIGQGFLIFFVTVLFDVLGRPVLDPLIAHLTGTSATLAEQHFASVRGNLGLFLYLAAVGWLFGGLGEELMTRGFIMTRFAQLLGEGRWAWIAALVLQAIPFALGHAYQGPVGMVSIFLGALITGAGTLIWGRNLWPAIIAHGLQDTLGFFALYVGIAHG